VDNAQAYEPDEKTRTLYNVFRKPHPFWKLRKTACGVYNCAGLVWANRRTSIYEENEYLKILMDDGYRPTTEEQLQPGDIVIYLTLTTERNTIHVGIVLYLDHIGTTTVPWILSKWHEQYGEDIHILKDVPEYYGNYLIEFWTDRL
jgi:hypothetical protein